MKPDPEKIDRLGAALQAVFGRVVNEPIPERLVKLLERLK